MKKTDFYINVPDDNVLEDCTNILHGDIEHCETEEDVITLLSEMLDILKGNYDNVDIYVKAYNEGV